MILNQSLDLSSFIAIASTCDVISIDTETNAEDIRDSRGYLTDISMACDPGHGVTYVTYAPLRRQNLDGSHDSNNLELEDRIKLFEFIESYSGAVVFHNAKFDLASLKTAGIDYTGKFYCTLLIAHLIDENYPYSYSLNACVAAYLDKEEAKKEELLKKAVIAFGWQRVPMYVMKEYAEYDAILTLHLWFKLKSKFEDENLEVYWEHKQKFTRVIIAMESYGIKVDLNLCKDQEHTGMSILKELEYAMRGNPASSIFLRKTLIDELGLPVVKRSAKTNEPSFDKEAMEIYDAMLERINDPTAQQVKEFRGWQKSVSSNYIPYQALISPDGRLRPNFKLHGTKTGRMSCEKPNLQQIPRVSNKPWNGSMKAAFIPEKGYELWEFDYSQLELRLGTAYAKELSLLQVFKEGRDIFSEMSNDVGLSRQDTKTLVYTTQYGGGVKRISHVFGVSESRAAELRQNYFDAYPGFALIAKHAANVCLTKGKIKLWSGRYRHFRFRKDEAHKAFNSVIQGGAADIVEHVMVKLFNEVHDGIKARMLLQVHDSVVFELRKEVVEEFKDRIVKIMTAVEPDFGVVFAVDAHRWGE